MAAGMNWGILSLLVMIVLVLGGFAGFFIFLARRAAAVAATSPATMDEQSHESWSADGGAAEDLMAKTLAYRSNLKPSTVLAQPPHRCAPTQAAGRVTGPRKQA
jgi:hypothetical protein